MDMVGMVDSVDTMDMVDMIDMDADCREMCILLSWVSWLTGPKSVM